MPPTRHGSYVQSFFDRLDPGYGGAALKGALWSLTAAPLGAIFAAMLGGRYGLVGGPLSLIGLLVAGALGGWYIAFKFSMEVANAPAHALTATLMPSGSSTAYAHNFSLEDSLVIRGDIAAALELYERGIRERPGDVEVRIRAADLCQGKGANAPRAAELWREVQRHPAVLPEKMLYATHRLVDLYVGPLREPGRALVELRRIIDTFPDSTSARHAREALARLKAEQAAPSPGTPAT
jgi:hypothetical protein